MHANVGDAAPLVELVESIVTHAREAWPGVEQSATELLPHLVSKLEPERPPEEAMEALHTEDLFLAHACVLGRPRAHEAFDALAAGVIDRAMARLDGGEAVADEVRQRVRELVLLPREDGPPRIADFSGKSSLAAWVKVIAVREAVRLIKESRRDVPADDDQLAEALAPDAGPELAYLKGLYRAEFRAAVREAIELLSDREKVLLRQNALDGVSIDRLAALHGVHRATAARWIQRAKASLLAGTRQVLLDRLRVSPPELESILRLIESQLEASLDVLL